MYNSNDYACYVYNNKKNNKNNNKLTEVKEVYRSSGDDEGVDYDDPLAS